MKSFRTVGLLAGVIFALLIAGSTAFYLMIARPGPLSQEKIVLVPAGTGMRTIASIFAREGVIETPQIFVWISRATHLDRKIRAGEYLIPPRTSLIDLLKILRSGQVVLHKLTIPEGRTSLEITRLLEATPGLTGKIATIPAEGSLLPQTYYFILGDGRNEMISRMQRAMSDYLGSAWILRADGLPFKTAQEALILASIVERETGYVDERAHVAGVYINRLNQGMRLQADPTVAYGLGNGAAGLTLKDLRQPTPYNTYVFKGLPPTPITNPGAKAIAAVLNPMKTDDLFFVADGTGGHSFAATLEEHNRNVAKWRRIEKAKPQN